MSVVSVVGCICFLLLKCFMCVLLLLHTKSPLNHRLQAANSPSSNDHNNDDRNNKNTIDHNDNKNLTSNTHNNSNTKNNTNTNSKSNEFNEDKQVVERLKKELQNTLDLLKHKRLQEKDVKKELKLKEAEVEEFKSKLEKMQRQAGVTKDSTFDHLPEVPLMDVH